jgi:hypothetical protein
MPYTPTGRPPGRPKTKEYETLTARVPQDIADHARAYASRHRQTLSDVLRDGLHLLLEEDRYHPYMSDVNGTPEIVSDIIVPKNEAEIVANTNGTPEIVSDMIHMQRLRAIVSDAIQTAGEPEIVSDTNDIHPVPLDAEALAALPAAPVTIQIDERPTGVSVPPFDIMKYALGEICKHGHDYQGTGQSLRRLADHECLACQRARAQAARQRKRQAAPVA